MKSYTDIEQSKVLAEILPLESADMWWAWYSNPLSNGHYDNFPIFCKPVCNPDESVPCWSLAALSGVMPQITEWNTPYGHKNDKLSQFEPKICNIWEHSIIPSFKVSYGNGLSTDIYDNPVDACVAMIEKLNELKML